jgi:NAD(P)-dependent dehydrogenase (short-subunit alcohol dehydrogenase family)
MVDKSQTRVAWVTGGSAGIGLAIAKTIADAGYKVVISARNE